MSAIPVGQVTYRENLRFETRERIPEWKKKIASTVAIHEAIHADVSEAVIFRSVDGASIIPGETYSGITYINRMSAVAAVAPHADGCDGTGHDLHIAELMGADISATAAVAKGIINTHRDEIQAIAVALDEKKTVSGDEIRSIIAEVKEGVEVDIFIYQHNGSTLHTSQKTKEKHIDLTQVELPF